MAEIYTCTCGGQRWKLFGPTIECEKCEKEYTLMWEVGIDGQMETPKEFNERIKKEEIEMVAKDVRAGLPFPSGRK